MDSKYLQRTLKKAKITNANDLPIEMYYSNLKSVINLLRSSKKTAHLDRPKWLDELAAAKVAASGGKSTVEKKVENKKRIEQQHRDARIIRRASGKLQ